MQLAERRLERPGVPPQVEYRQLSSAFERARRTEPALVREGWFTFADHPARIRVVGVELARRVFRALSHLERAPGEAGPSLRIDLWDERATGVGVEGLEPGDDLDAEGETFVSDDGRVVVTARTQTRTTMHRPTQRLVGWVHRHDRLTLYELGRPLHSELLLWHKDRGIQAIHAGLVARGGDGVLFGGPGGAGKSTTALTCLRAGFEYLADDYVALERPADGGFVGHSLYASTHLEPGHLRRFPFLVPHAIAGTLPREDKSLVLLSEVLPGGLGRTARIRAVALPRVTEAHDTVVRPASTVESLLRLAPSSLLMLPYAGIAEREFDKLSDFLAEVPTYWLEIGRDMDQIPRRIDEILERHA